MKCWNDKRDIKNNFNTNKNINYNSKSMYCVKDV